MCRAAVDQRDGSSILPHGAMLVYQTDSVMRYCIICEDEKAHDIVNLDDVNTATCVDCKNVIDLNSGIERAVALLKIDLTRGEQGA